MRPLPPAPLLFLALAAGCRDPVPAPAPEAPAAEAHPDERPHQALPRRVRLKEDLVVASGIEVERSVRGRLRMTLALPGEVVAEPDRTARVSAAVAGRLERIAFNEGDVVGRGQVLAVLRVADVGRLRGALGAVQARAQAARANAARLRSLAAQGLGATQAVVDAEADLHAQDAEARALEEQLAAIGASAGSEGGFLVPIRAPLSGVVVARDAVLGQPVSTEQVLGTVVDLSEVWFVGRVFEKDLGRLRAGAPADVQLNAFPGEHFQGAVEHVGQQIDPLARTLTARVRLDNPARRLRLGLFGAAHVAVEDAGQATPRVLIPRSAVTDLGGASVVFVREADGDFLLHEVLLGEAALGQVQVLSGLDEGEAVVSHGVFTLKSLLLKATLAGEE